MSLTFAIAEQSVTLPDGTVLDFKVNADDSSVVELHISGFHQCDITFKRNGDLLGLVERDTVTTLGAEDGAPAATPENYPSVDKDAVRDPIDEPFTNEPALGTGVVNTTALLSGKKSEAEIDP